jgi:hypothetical protein
MYSVLSQKSPDSLSVWLEAWNVRHVMDVWAMTPPILTEPSTAVIWIARILANHLAQTASVQEKGNGNKDKSKQDNHVQRSHDDLLTS